MIADCLRKWFHANNAQQGLSFSIKNINQLKYYLASEKDWENTILFHLLKKIAAVTLRPLAQV